MPVIDVYTDGSCLVNPGGPGGYAVVFDTGNGDFKTLARGGDPKTTNNRMELTAMLEALRKVSDYDFLKRCPKGTEIRIHTDSGYVHNALTKGWLQRWKLAGWKRQTKKQGIKPVLNDDLWRQILSLDSFMRMGSSGVILSYVKVPGHSGIPGNERADEVARGEAEARDTSKGKGRRRNARKSA